MEAFFVLAVFCFYVDAMLLCSSVVTASQTGGLNRAREPEPCAVVIHK